MKTQTVSDVVEDKNIPLDEILDIFEGYGYGKEEMQDFLDSDMTDLSDAFPELKKLLNGQKRKPKSLDAIKDEHTPPGAKGEDESSPQAEVRYKTPEDLMIPTMSDEDLANSIDGIERGQSDLTDAEQPIVKKWIKEELEKRKNPKGEEPKSPGAKNEDINNPYLKSIRTKIGVDTEDGIKKYLSINGVPSFKEIEEQNPGYKQIYSENAAEEESEEDLNKWLNAPEDGKTGWFKRAEHIVDTNGNGEIEEDEMADFQKSLDDYASKNKKGRDDIPVTTRR